MKKIAISQRVDEIREYNEVRDSLDQNWCRLFQRMEAVLFPVPNMPEHLEDVLECVQPDAIVLSGGVGPVKYEGTSMERDAVDEGLITYAIQRDIPLLGVCRGMQSVALYFGSTLKRVGGHIAVYHKVVGEINREVNSFHSMSINKPGDGLQVLATTENGDIEAVAHRNYKVYGIMWHPERVPGFAEEDIAFIRKILMQNEKENSSGESGYFGSRSGNKA